MIYQFATDATGGFSGTIWAAPPFDQGMPYVQYIEARTGEVYEASTVDENNFKTAQIDYPSYPTRYPNSVILPSVCLIGDSTITCAGQTYDPSSQTMTIDGVYKESVEPRTFFFSWRDRLNAVRQKWSIWTVQDTCAPLRAAWVSDWWEWCSTDFHCKNNWYFSGCIFMCSGYNDCQNGNPVPGEPFPNPTIYIRPYADGKEYTVKWKAEFPYHESGHWLWFLIQGKHFYVDSALGNGDICSGTLSAQDPMRSLTDSEKCQSGQAAYNSPGGSWIVPDKDTTTLTEAFAESHLMNFAYVNTTGYGLYERTAAGEVDGKCEVPWNTDSAHDDSRCYQCGICSEIPPMVGVNPNRINCDDYFNRSCSDAPQPPCARGPYSTQVALLMDVYDNVNARYYDGDTGSTGEDTINNLPLGTIVRLLILKAEAGTPIVMDSTTNIGHFLNAIKAHCGNDTQDQAIDDLRAYFGAPAP